MNKTYIQRIQELKNEGMTNSDAQGVADAEILNGAIYID